jgi:hypothetical protein
MARVACWSCDLIGGEKLCDVCRAELQGRSLLTWDVDVVAAFVRLVLCGGVESESEAA